MSSRLNGNGHGYIADHRAYTTCVSPHSEPNELDFHALFSYDDLFAIVVFITSPQTCVC